MFTRFFVPVMLAGCLLLAGCGSSSPAAAFTPSTTPAAPALTLSASALSFPATTQGQSSAAQSISLVDTGTSTLTLSALTLSDTRDYALMTTCGASLASAATCTASVTFTPQSAASLPATLTVTDNAASSPQTVSLTGTGTAVPVPTATLSAAALSFASTPAGVPSLPQTVTLTNSGSAALSGLAITLGGANPAVFSQTTTCGNTLAAGASCTVAVVFTPAAASTAYSGTLTLTDNSGGSAGATQTALLSGSGAAAVLPSLPSASLSAGSLSFPQTAYGTSSPAQTVTLANLGSAPLSIASVAASGSYAGAFTETNTCPASLAAGSSCSITVSFTQSLAVSSATGSLSVTDNSGGVGGSMQTVALSGSNPPPMPQAVLSSTAASFAATPLGSSAATQTVTLSNPGTGALTGVSVALTGAGTAFSYTTTCAGTLAAGASCTLTISFTPPAAGTYSGTLSVMDGASNSPQTVALSGTGTAPASTLSAGSLAFPNTAVRSSSAAQSVTLTNTGTAPLSIASIVLGGANASSFAETTTCTATLAVNSSCTISATFTPASASNLSAAITVTSNAGSSPQTVALSGTGTAAAATHTMLVFPEPDNTITPLYALINGATRTIDMTMYELVDSTFSADLVAACNRGVKVRVILDQSLEKSSNTPAYNQLNAVANCSAAWSNLQFQATHEKSFVIDNQTLAIMSLNLTSRYYSTTRDYAWIENDPSDIAAVEATFNTDYSSSTDFSYAPGAGTDLIWSPTTATADLLGIINGATKTLLVENEEMSASNIVSALEAACRRGVAVHIAMTDTGSYHANYAALEAAGCGVHLYPDTATALYIHGKALVADYGLATQSVYMGSINFSTASMTENRELGAYITDSASIQTLNTTIAADYAGAAPY